MRPRDESTRERLLPALSRLGPSKAPDLARALGVSPASALRFLRDAGPAVLAAGSARRRRYAVRRALRGSLAPLPLYAIDEAGRTTQVGELALVQPQGCWLALDATQWPVPAESADGWWDGLPYPLLDMRPQGYMGRQLAGQVHDALDIGADPRLWSDDEVLLVLAHHGADLPGNLVLGERALRAWQQLRAEDAAPLAEDFLAQAYPALAVRALAEGSLGSSAGGEFPKFTALRSGAAVERPVSTQHVIVKFSGAGASAAERRWADLLLCEHHAAQALATLPGQLTAATRVLQFGGRTFLEVQRFDRVGRWGRRPLLSLAMADAGLAGSQASEWPALLQRLRGLRLCDDATLAAAGQRWWFGRLTANTDMHAGNLSLHPRQRPGLPAGLDLAPSYDMLPMLYAPLTGGETPARNFQPPGPLPADQAAWQAAAGAAQRFWAQVAQDARVSDGFRRLAEDSGTALEHIAQTTVG